MVLNVDGHKKKELQGELMEKLDKGRDSS